MIDNLSYFISHVCIIYMLEIPREEKIYTLHRGNTD